MRVIVEGWGRRVIDLELMVPLRKPGPAGPAVPGHDPCGTTAAQVEQADDGVHGMGFGLVVKARGKAGP